MMPQNNWIEVKELLELMKQNQYSLLSVAEMALFYMQPMKDILMMLKLKVMAFERALHEFARSKHKDLLDMINGSLDYNDDIAAKMKSTMDDFKAKWSLVVAGAVKK